MAASRYTLLLNEEAAHLVESLREGYRLKTKADVYDLAVRVLHWHLEQGANGFEVGRFRQGQFEPLLLTHSVSAARIR